MRLRTLLIISILSIYSTGHADCLNDFCLQSSTGTKRCQSDYLGRPTIIDFWTSWCPNCRTSLDWLGKLRAHFKEKDLGLIAINLDENRADADEVIGELPPTLEVLIDADGSTAEKCALSSIPATILLDKKGAVIHRWFGDSEKNHAEIIKSLDLIRKD